MPIINAHHTMQYSLMQLIFINRTPDISRPWFPRLLLQLVAPGAVGLGSKEFAVGVRVTCIVVTLCCAAIVVILMALVVADYLVDTYGHASILVAVLASLIVAVTVAIPYWQALCMCARKAHRLAEQNKS